MTAKKFKSICDGVLKIVKKHTPVDTGNLKFNAVRIKYISANKIVILVDQDIAPYMVYTNEPWISPKWHGKKNPNQAWWNNVIPLIVDYINKQVNNIPLRTRKSNKQRQKTNKDG